MRAKRRGSANTFFKKLKDLHRKLASREKKLKLVDIPLTTTSNSMYQQIERFDIGETYKTANVSKDLVELIRKESADIRDVNKTVLEGFISTKHFMNSEFIDESSEEYQEPTASSVERKKKFNFEPPLTSIEQKTFIDSYRKEFELEI